VCAPEAPLRGAVQCNAPRASARPVPHALHLSDSAHAPSDGHNNNNNNKKAAGFGARARASRGQRQRRRRAHGPSRSRSSRDKRGPCLTAPFVRRLSSRRHARRSRSGAGLLLLDFFFKKNNVWTRTGAVHVGRNRRARLGTGALGHVVWRRKRRRRTDGRTDRRSSSAAEAEAAAAACELS
jgi:hypothetical protein